MKLARARTLVHVEVLRAARGGAEIGGVVQRCAVIRSYIVAARKLPSSRRSACNIMQPYSATHSQSGAYRCAAGTDPSKGQSKLAKQKGRVALVDGRRVEIAHHVVVVNVNLHRPGHQYSAKILSHYPSTTRRHQTACILQDKLYCL